MKRTILVALAMLCSTAGAGRAEVIHLQNGVAPTPEYRGCVDTRISVYNDAEARGRRGGEGKVQVFRTFSSARRILVKFDLAALLKGRAVGRALLRVYCTSPTRLSSQMFAAPLTREWDETATGFEYAKTDDDKGPEGNWARKGGDYDAEAVLKAPCRGGSFGHAFEFDVSAVVADWLADKRPNHGLILWSSQHTTHSIASSEWPNADYRPELLVATAAKELKPWPAPAKQVPLSPMAGTADTGRAEGAYGSLTLGLHTHAMAHDGVTDGYVKAGHRLAGDWSWMPHLRVGGGAGEFNTARLSFDLRQVPKFGSVKSAKLRLYVAGGSPGVRFGLCRGRLEVPGKETAGPAPVAVAAIRFPTQKERQAGAAAATIEWDLTGAVRAAAGGKLDLTISHHVEGGFLDAYSSKYDDPDVRPWLAIECSPVPAVAVPPRLKPLPVPTGDYWIEPMREVHRRFKGDANTLGQYGDSITITMAFLATHSSGSCIPQKCPPEVKKRLEIVDEYANKKLWGQWKDPKYGNNGSMTVAWAFANVDAWQKLCKPEVAVILFGTNDCSYGPVPPDHTEMMARVVDRCLSDGTIPILTTLPPRGDQKRSDRVKARVRELRRAQIAVARSRKIPLIDFYTEMVSRQPDKWDKTLMGDSLHPSYRNPWKMDFTEAGLKNSGYTLRNYLTMMMYAEIIEKVLQPAGQAAD